MKTTENLLIGATYIPPDNSVFYNEEEVVLLENEITSFSSKYKYIMLTGDFNARTSELRDYTERDEFLAEMFDFDAETIYIFSKASQLEDYSVPIERKSKDKHINNSGYRLIDICKNNNLFILNGRFGKDKGIGNYTFRSTSVIDYTIVSSDVFSFLADFEITETDSLFSDGHSILKFTLVRPNMPNERHTKTYSNSNQDKPKWNPKYKQSFCRNIDMEEVNLI